MNIFLFKNIYQIHEVFLKFMITFCDFFPWKSWTFIQIWNNHELLFHKHNPFLKSTIFFKCRNFFSIPRTFIEPMIFFEYVNFFRIHLLFLTFWTFWTPWTFFETKIFFRINELFLNSLFTFKNIVSHKVNSQSSPANRENWSAQIEHLPPDWAGPHGGACVVTDRALASLIGPAHTEVHVWL